MLYETKSFVINIKDNKVVFYIIKQSNMFQEKYRQPQRPFFFILIQQKIARLFNILYKVFCPQEPLQERKKNWSPILNHGYHQSKLN